MHLCHLKNKLQHQTISTLTSQRWYTSLSLSSLQLKVEKFIRSPCELLEETEISSLT